jgi:TRAP-type C4-dicarboxylate transport system permease small subunit
MKRLSSVIRIFENGVSFTALTALLLAVLWGVLTRYVTERPAVWTSELAGILFTWVVFIGTMTAFREGRHIRITLLTDLLPTPARRFLKLLADIVVVVFLVYVTWLSIRMMQLGATRLSPVMRIPFSWVYLATVISFGAMSITSVLRLLGLVDEPGANVDWE